MALILEGTDGEGSPPMGEQRDFTKQVSWTLAELLPKPVAPRAFPRVCAKNNSAFASGTSGWVFRQIRNSIKTPAPYVK